MNGSNREQNNIFILSTVWRCVSVFSFDTMGKKRELSITPAPVLIVHAGVASRCIYHSFSCCCSRSLSSNRFLWNRQSTLDADVIFYFRHERLMMMLLYSVKCERNGALNLFEMQINNMAPHFYTQIQNAFSPLPRNKRKILLLLVLCLCVRPQLVPLPPIHYSYQHKIQSETETPAPKITFIISYNNIQSFAIIPPSAGCELDGKIPFLFPFSITMINDISIFVFYFFDLISLVQIEMDQCKMRLNFSNSFLNEIK